MFLFSAFSPSKNRSDHDAQSEDYAHGPVRMAADGPARGPNFSPHSFFNVFIAISQIILDVLPIDPRSFLHVRVLVTELLEAAVETVFKAFKFSLAESDSLSA